MPSARQLRIEVAVVTPNGRGGPPSKSGNRSATGIVSPAGRFRDEIGRALALGAGPEDLLLRLTLGDANRLLRDRDMPAGDIRFEAGVMRFLGVTVQQGSVEASVLELADRVTEG